MSKTSEVLKGMADRNGDGKIDLQDAQALLAAAESEAAAAVQKLSPVRAILSDFVIGVAVGVLGHKALVTIMGWFA